MHLPLDKFFGGKVEGFHQLRQHFQILLLQVYKLAGFQLVIFFLLLIAFQDIQKFLTGNIICGNIQIQKSSRQGYAHRNFYCFQGVLASETIGAAYLTKLHKSVRSRFHHMINQILFSGTVQDVKVGIIIRQPFHCLSKNTVFQRKITELLLRANAVVEKGLA